MIRARIPEGKRGCGQIRSAGHQQPHVTMVQAIYIQQWTERELPGRFLLIIAWKPSKRNASRQKTLIQCWNGVTHGDIATPTLGRRWIEIWLKMQIGVKVYYLQIRIKFYLSIYTAQIIDHWWYFCDWVQVFAAVLSTSQVYLSKWPSRDHLQ